LLSLAPARADDVAAAAFSQWQASCRDDGYCTASTTAAPLANTVTLHIGRPARQTYWELGVQLGRPLADAATPFVVEIGQQSFSFPAHDGVALYGGLDDYFFTGPAAQALLDALVPGRTATVSYRDRDGTPETLSFALQGLPAALIWIDGRQHRIGSERVAGTPPYGLPRIVVEATRPLAGAPNAGPPMVTFSEAGDNTYSPGG
jgi:hypothetical protein